MLTYPPLLWVQRVFQQPAGSQRCLLRWSVRIPLGCHLLLHILIFKQIVANPATSTAVTVRGITWSCPVFPVPQQSPSRSCVHQCHVPPARTMGGILLCRLRKHYEWSWPFCLLCWMMALMCSVRLHARDELGQSDLIMCLSHCKQHGQTVVREAWGELSGHQPHHGLEQDQVLHNSLLGGTKRFFTIQYYFFSHFRSPVWWITYLHVIRQFWVGGPHALC